MSEKDTGGTDCCCQTDTAQESTAESCCCSDSEPQQAADGCCCSTDADDDAENESCCCSDESCCCDEEAAADEAYAGEPTVIAVQYLYLDQTVCDRCQGGDARVEQAMAALRPALELAGYTVELERIEVRDEETAIRHRFASSPTIRVNGTDICPSIIENQCDCCRDLSDYDVYCRQFEFNGKLFEVPPTALVARRILELAFVEPQADDEPFELPENIHGFLAGRAEKEARNEGSSCCC